MPGVPSTHAYLGISSSLDGFSMLFGIKVSSVKIMFPILMIRPADMEKKAVEEEMRSEASEIGM